MYNNYNNDRIKSKFLFFFTSEKERELNTVGSCNGPTEFLKAIFLCSFRFHESEIELLEVRFECP